MLTAAGDRPGAGPAPDAVASRKATHVVIAPAVAREAASGTAAVFAELTPGMQVTLVERSGTWALVARDGRRLGYVQDEPKALAPLH